MSQGVSLFSLSSSGTTPSAWTFTIQDLVTTIDRLYRICDISENTKPCIEVIQQLKKSLNDFETLKNRLEKKHGSQADVETPDRIGTSANTNTPPGQNFWTNGNPLTVAQPSVSQETLEGKISKRKTQNAKIPNVNPSKASAGKSNIASTKNNTAKPTTSKLKSKATSVEIFSSQSKVEKSTWADRTLTSASPNNSSPVGKKIKPFLAPSSRISLQDAQIEDGDQDLRIEDIDLTSMSPSKLLSLIDKQDPSLSIPKGLSWYEATKSPSPTKQRELEKVHERLTSPSRVKISHQTLVDKQEKAKLNREQQNELRREEARKSTERVRLAMQRREEKQQQLLKTTEEKHKRAEENARLHVELISESARAENQKVDEFKFYNQIRTDTLLEKTNSKLNSSESRRKRQIQSKIEKLEREKIKEKEAKEKRDKLHEQKHKSLIEKESTRKAAEARREVIEKKEHENLTQKNAEKAAKVQETNKKLQILQEQKLKSYLEKLENSERRKSEQLQSIKQKAVSVSERVKEVKTRKNAYDVVEVSDENVNKQRKVTSSKRIKKLKHRLSKLKQEAEAYISLQDDSQEEPKIHPSLKRLLQDLKQQIQSKRHVAVTSLIHELIRFLDRKPEEIDNLRYEGIFDVLIQVIQKNDQKFPVAVASKLLSRICSTSDNVTYLVITLQILPIIQSLRDALFENRTELIPNLLTVFISAIRLTHIPENQTLEREIIRDLISMFSAQEGLDELLHLILRYIQNSQFGLSGTIQPMIHKAAYLLQSITEFMVVLRERENIAVYEKQNLAPGPEESVITELSHIVPELMTVLAHLLLKQGPSRGESFQQSISPSILNFCLAIFKLLNNYANISFRGFQKSMSEAEANSSKHVVAFLLGYCNRDMDIKPGAIPESDDPNHTSTKADIEIRLINEVVLFTGYFALDNEENQKILQNSSGKGNIIQLLCQLPIQYFADEGFKSVLVPTLISVSYKSEDNVSILGQEMSLETLITSQEGYMNSRENAEDIEQPKSNLRKAFLPQNRIFLTQDTIDFYRKFVK